MKITSPLLQGLAGLSAAHLIRSWMSTLDYRAYLYETAIDPARPEYDGRKIYIFWHENILFPLYLRGHCNLAMLLSRHRDADILARVAHHLGFNCVRGSTARGGAAAVRELERQSRERNLTITPDGPRGPRRRLAPGPIFLASKLRMPLVAMGLAYHRPWRLNSWDRFAVPRPGSRARAVVSPSIHLPENLGREQVEHYRQRIERLLNWLTEEAQAWADSGRRMPREMVVRPQAAPLRSQQPRGYGVSREGGTWRAESDAAQWRPAA